MHIERVYHQSNFQVSEFGYKHYACGVYLNPGDDVEEAKRTAKQFVQEWYEQDNPHLKGRPVIQQSFDEMPGIADIDKQEPVLDAEFEALKESLSHIEFFEDAKAYLDSTTFHLSYEARNLIKNKSSKK